MEEIRECQKTYKETYAYPENLGKNENVLFSNFVWVFSSY